MQNQTSSPSTTVRKPPVVGAFVPRPDLKRGPVIPVSIAEIKEDPHNPRGTFDDLEGLAHSIHQVGILQPLLLRSDMTLLCGARRLRAAKMIKLPTVPAQTIECSDAEAIEIQIIENSQRADVHPMEEAEAYGRLGALVAAVNKTPAAPISQRIAAKVGKTHQHVVQRMRLLFLPDVARRAYRSGKIGGDASKKLFDNGHLRESAAYIDPAAEHWLKGKHRSNRSLVGKAKLTPVLATDPDGAVVELWDRKEFEAARKIKPEASSGSSRSSSENDQLKRRKIDLEAKRRLKLALIAKVRKGVKERAFLQALAKMLIKDAFSSYSPHDKAIWLRYAPAKSRKAILEGKDLNVIRAAVLDHGLGDPGFNFHGDGAMGDVGRAFGLELSDFVAQVKAERAAKKKGKAR